MDDKPRDEIEITPEMLAAGIEAVEMWSASDLPEWKAVDIYRQMELARRRSMVALSPLAIASPSVPCKTVDK